MFLRVVIEVAEEFCQNIHIVEMQSKYFGGPSILGLQGFERISRLTCGLVLNSEEWSYHIIRGLSSL